MIFTLALRSLLSRPVRSAVLAGGFGLGVAVMAALLGIGGVILEQARAPALVGGGDVVVGGATGRLSSARFVLSSVLGADPLAPRVAVAAPSMRATLFLMDGRGATPIAARGGVPSLDRGLDDPEIAHVAGWTDTAADREWTAADTGSVLRAMDRFHPIPDVPARAGSWAEWLYFNGRAGTSRFYLTFLAGPRLESGRRVLGVRLQLERRGALTSFSHSVEVDDEALADAPDLAAGLNRVRLVGRDYHIELDLPAESGTERAVADIVLSAAPGRSLPPFTMRGAGGWISGYVVPVMAGELSGEIRVDRETIPLTGGAGYHDHNWGFWEGVRWQWGQVQGQGMSFVYGRIHPPPDAADTARLPGFLVALGSEGSLGYATDVSIEETNEPDTKVPRRIIVRGQSESLSLTLDLAVEQVTSTRMRQGFFGSGMDFLQLRATYKVSGRAGNRDVGFTAAGSAETFREGVVVARGP